jgi:L-threonylcarbamoyladenylate synthase
MEKAEILARDHTELIVQNLKQGKIGMIPSDTLYGLTCSALNKQAVENIYKIKGRDSSKPVIVLINSIENIKEFGIDITENQRVFLQNNWPNKLTVVLTGVSSDLDYIHRGKYSIGFRIPNDAWLQQILLHTGPLISTTVNLSGENPINSVPEAIKSFGQKIDFYVDVGELNSPPSTVISLQPSGTFDILRQGSVDVYANKD